LKISVCSTAINNQPRFTGKTTLLLTGERAEESSNRASYFKFEKHSSNGKKRTVHQYRPVHSWKEQRVWDLIEKYRVNPHPAYKLGWGRVSCMTCIFGNKDQWASVAKIAPKKVEKISQYETQFGITIQRKQSVEEMVEAGTAYDTMKDSDVNDAMSHEYNQPIILPEGQAWEMPAGAFGDSCGPI
jgi:3'-phosphoadenosine 5'-phosphosulfate sulfotransferase (PAPS reductase)/FAD synthetase